MKLFIGSFYCKKIRTAHSSTTRTTHIQSQKFKMSNKNSRDLLIYRAKLAEQAEGFEKMAATMKSVAEMSPHLSIDERNLLSVAYKVIEFCFIIFLFAENWTQYWTFSSFSV